MRKEEKNQLVDSITELLNTFPNVYITDTSNLNVETINNFRRLCFKKEIKLQVVKNTLLKRAMEQSGKNFEEIYPFLKGPTSIMLSDTSSLPAKLIKEFRKKATKPAIKAAYIEESIYTGDNLLEVLASIKTKNEMIGEVISLLQSPAKNVVSALQSGKHIIAGIVKTLSEK
ncbi:MAG: 50S ribosomal protein L10 [Bacteroidota bacterium]